MRLAIVVPCYNEAETLRESAGSLLKLLDAMTSAGEVDADSFILLCNDGSTDATAEIMQSLHSDDNRIKGITLARNSGQQRCLMAGLLTVMERCDAAVTIDADLQDDINVIPSMVKLCGEGYDIVYGVRDSRRSDSIFKRSTARSFYRLQQAMDIDIVYDHADFRLMSRRAIECLSRHPERNLYLRGLIPSLGLPSTTVEYSRRERTRGETKYSLRRMLSLSLDGITSFSSKPMRMIWVVGLILLLMDIGVAIYVLGSWINERTISGWTSIMLSIWFLGSLILMSIGVIGEYLGKIFIEVKHRPLYTIIDHIGLDNEMPSTSSTRQ